MSTSRTWDDGQLKLALATAHCLTDVVKSLGLKTGGNNHKTILHHIHRLGLDYSHLDPNTRRVSTWRGGQKRFTNEEMFTENSNASGKHVKSRVYRENLIPYCCSECGNTGGHNGKPLTLQLDHINGSPTDNRIENLRFLCPNCHSQTPTYAGRSRKTIPSVVPPVKGHPHKANHTEVYARYKETGNYTLVGKEFGLSPNGVRKIVLKQGFSQLQLGSVTSRFTIPV